jgi:hypothetical protein
MAAVVLVEGASDRIALDTLAVRRGRDLDAEGVAVVPIGGAQAIGKVVARLRLEQPAVKLTGLCDAGEALYFRRALERDGFYVCDPDLEDELIRAVGAPAVQELLERENDLHSFRTFQKQPAQQWRPTEAQLRRFMGTRSGRKARYARLLVDTLDLARVPRALDSVLDAAY